MPFGLQPTHLILILAVALIIFGPSRLPELGKAVGKTLKEFKSATNEMSQSLDVTKAAAPAPSAPVASAEPAKVPCKQCSKPIQPGAKFCPECGAAQ